MVFPRDGVVIIEFSFYFFFQIPLAILGANYLFFKAAAAVVVLRSKCGAMAKNVRKCASSDWSLMQSVLPVE